MKINSLEDLFKSHVLELYDAERQNRRSLNKMARGASTPELQQLFRRHARQTKGQLDRLDAIISRLGCDQKVKSKAMSGLIYEAKQLLKTPLEDRELMDAALTLAGQKIENYEIFTYSALINIAKSLHFDSDVELLGQTLAEEKTMEERLIGISENFSFEAVHMEEHQPVGAH